MRLEDVQAKLRVRSDWQAVDLGMRLAYRWWPSLVCSYLICATPVLLLCFFVLPGFTGYIVFWWCKPLYERAILMNLSSFLFGSQPRASAIVSGYRDPRLWLAMTFCRFSWRRATIAPLSALENVGGVATAERRRALTEGNESISFWLSLNGLMVEVIMIASVYALTMFVANIEETVLFFDDLRKEIHPELSETWFRAISFFALFIGIGLVAPFYVATGFALYLNSRIKAEAWDIELGFKKLLSRLSVLFLCFCCVLPTIDLSAENDELAAESKASIAELLKHGDITQESTSYFNPLPESSERAERSDLAKSILSFFSVLVQIVLFSALGIGAVVLLANLTTMAKDRLGYRTRHADMRVSTDRTWADIPNDISDAAMELWKHGEAREAVALIYAGSLKAIDARFRCNLTESDTERECVDKVKTFRPHILEQFRDITSLWIACAYGGTAPSFEGFSAALAGYQKIAADA